MLSSSITDLEKSVGLKDTFEAALDTVFVDKAYAAGPFLSIAKICFRKGHIENEQRLRARSISIVKLENWEFRAPSGTCVWCLVVGRQASRFRSFKPEALLALAKRSLHGRLYWHRTSKF
jgi:hypothetical protein